MPDAINSTKFREASKAKAINVVVGLDGMKLRETVGVVCEGYS